VHCHRNDEISNSVGESVSNAVNWVENEASSIANSVEDGVMAAKGLTLILGREA